MTLEKDRRTEQEGLITRGVYVAITLPPELHQCWNWALTTTLATHKTYNNPDRLKRRLSSTSRIKPHFTIAYFGDISRADHMKLDGLIVDNLDLLIGSEVQIGLPIIIGGKDKALVGLVRPSEGIIKFRKIIEDDFPNIDFPPFLPHYTFDEIKRGKLTLSEAREALTFMYPGLPTQPVRTQGVYIGRKN